MGSDMKEFTTSQLETMRQVDIRTLDRNDLVDIQDVSIHKELEREARILDYMNQIKNPYCFKYGEYAVKIGFTDTEITLTDRMKEFIERTCTVYT